MEREQVDDPAAHGDIATVADLVLGSVPEREQPLNERRQVGGLADNQFETERLEMARREGALHYRADRGDDNGR